jgi:hypothetical protein
MTDLQNGSKSEVFLSSRQVRYDNRLNAVLR